MIEGVRTRERQAGPTLLWVLFVVVLVLLGGCAPSLEEGRVVPATPGFRLGTPDTLRVFWVNSYSPGNLWSLRVRNGILETLAREGYGLASGTLVWDTYHLLEESDLEMSDPALVAARGDAALSAIAAFDPDVVIVSDDEAAQLVLPRYPDAEQKFVYCGVLEAWPTYARKSVTGVLEHMYPVQGMAIAEALLAAEAGSMVQESPLAGKSLLILGDASPSGEIAVRLARDELAAAQADGSLGEMSILTGTAASWEAWKGLVLAHEVDLVLVASYLPLPAEDGMGVSTAVMMAWMREHSSGPVFSLAQSVVVDGAVGGLVADGYQQGRTAALLSIAAVRGAPFDPEDVPEGYNRLVINASAAQYWNLSIPVLFPRIAEVYSRPLVGGTGGSQ